MRALLKPAGSDALCWICCANRSCTGRKRCAAAPYLVVVRTRGTAPVSSTFTSTAPCLPLHTSSNRTDASSSSKRLPSVGKAYERIQPVILCSGGKVISRVHAEEEP